MKIEETGVFKIRHLGYVVDCPVLSMTWSCAHLEIVYEQEHKTRKAIYVPSEDKWLKLVPNPDDPYDPTYAPFAKGEVISFSFLTKVED